MIALLRLPATWIWALLCVATIVTTWGLSRDVLDHTVATVAILLIAGLKVRFVLLHFMELDRAPLAWRLFFEAWVLVVTGALIGGWLHG